MSPLGGTPGHQNPLRGFQTLTPSRPSGTFQFLTFFHHKISRWKTVIIFLGSRWIMLVPTKGGVRVWKSYGFLMTVGSLKITGSLAPPLYSRQVFEIDSKSYRRREIG